MINEKEKLCSRCGILLPFSAFSRQRGCTDGLRSFCRACAAKWNAAYYKKVTQQNKKLTIKEIMARTPVKKCYTCHLIKNSSLFGRCNRSKDGLDARCKECGKIAGLRHIERRKKHNLGLGSAKILENTPIKKCCKCKKVKGSADFNINMCTRDGLHNTCKACASKDGRLNRAKHKLRNARLTPEEIRCKTAVKKCSGCATIKSSFDFYLSSKTSDGLSNICTACNSKNTAKRFERDILYRIASNLRKRLGWAVVCNFKSGSTVKDLGCSISEFRDYLGSKFEAGMTWDNWGRGRGKWNIDHIVPLAVFNLEDRNQFLEACHYTNLQPLWFEENMRKGAKLNFKKERWSENEN